MDDFVVIVGPLVVMASRPLGAVGFFLVFGGFLRKSRSTVLWGITALTLSLVFFNDLSSLTRNEELLP